MNNEICSKKFTKKNCSLQNGRILLTHASSLTLVSSGLTVSPRPRWRGPSPWSRGSYYSPSSEACSSSLHRLDKNKLIRAIAKITVFSKLIGKQKIKYFYKMFKAINPIHQDQKAFFLLRSGSLHETLGHKSSQGNLQCH